MENGGHNPLTFAWLKFYAQQISYLYERVSADEAAALLYQVINEWRKAQYGD